MKRWLFLFLLVVLMIPFAIRLNHNLSIAGSEPYYHARMANSFLNGVDEGIVGEREYSLNPYHFLLAGFVKLFGDSALFFVPVVFGIFSFLFFSWILDFFKIDVGIKFFSLGIYALSPPLIGVSFLNTPRAFILSFILLGVLLCVKKHYVSSAVAFAVAAISGGVIPVIAAVAFLITVGWGNKDYNVGVILTVLVLYGSGLTGKILVNPGYISDFGAVYGFGLFGLLLACMGAVRIWPKTPKVLYVVPLVVVLFPQLIFVANVLVAFLAGIALSWLVSRTWHLDFIRNASLLVLFCGLLFSGLAQTVSLARLPPSEGILDLLELPPGVVLTYDGYGFWAEFAGHKVLADSFSGRSDKRLVDSQSMLHETGYDRAKELMADYGVSYILISDDMRQGLVWKRDNQGLDFLVENSESFKRVGSGEGFVVWKVS